MIGKASDRGVEGLRARSSFAPRASLVAILVGILVLSLGPIGEPDLDGVLRGLPHAIAYAILTLVALVAVEARSGDQGATTWSKIGLAILAAIAMGGLLELAQGLVHRDVQFSDFVADVVGALVALVVWLFVRARGRIASSGASSGDDAVSRR